MNKPSKTFEHTTQLCREMNATLSQMRKTLEEMKVCTQSNVISYFPREERRKPLRDKSYSRTADSS